LAFYDALETNEAAVRTLGDEILKKIAVELAENLRKNVSVDWSIRETVRAKLRLMVRRILRKYKYPPDHEARAVDLVFLTAARKGTHGPRDFLLALLAYRHGFRVSELIDVRLEELELSIPFEAGQEAL
jgi:integrase